MPDKTFIQVNREATKAPYEAEKQRNVIPIEFKLCADSRKEEYPYYVKVSINTNCISFDQGICAYGFKKQHGE